MVESEWSSLLGAGCSSDWGPLFFWGGGGDGGTSGIGGSEASTRAFVIVD